MTAHTEVLVVGGGYAGVMAANRLTQRDDVSVTLINPRPTFVPRLRLHQLVAGTHDAVVDYRDVLADRVRLVVDTATRIDAAGRSVTLTNGRAAGYDHLIYAVGSHSIEARVPGADEFAHPIATLEAAQRLRSIVEAVPATAALTVIGAGPTGLETAAELAEQGRRVTLVSGGVLGPYLHPRARRTASRRFAALGVTVVDGPDAKVTAVTRDSVHLRDGRELPSAVTIWTAGFGVPDLATRSGLRTDNAGRLVTDETLTSVDDEHIVAAGDSAAPSGLPFRMSAYAAGCLGAHAADTVLRRLAGTPPTAARVFFPAMCISFGRGAGIYQIAHRDDTAMRLFVSGRPGAKLKEFACESSVKHLINEARKPGSHRWLKNDNRPQLLAGAPA
ncbi:NAD(P)/FAD-dependent oxidoreductase [Cryptosporangium aurantiacum]|uniref:NADH dehydrogenase, FAD-containing subunit n=1 Tax=Cryptosporangium aurantiacum TaxID=134849 RepID=A0A1M7TY33_9ACTN|nr:FAD-dependent oxidoreductase [Cryptosporangium aurantiacum]SHN75595.1 NADH dehydrogenase, FAD-containing subunit [Cryptosporangium aurantiacum]